MKKYHVEIEGVCPVRMNRFTNQKKLTKPTEDMLIEDAFLRTYVNEKGQFVIPPKSIKAVLVNGGSKVTHGRGKAKASLKAITTVLPKEGVAIKVRNKAVTRDNDSHYFIHQEDVRIPPRTGSRVIQYWIAFPEGWTAEFEVIVFDDIMPKETIEQSLISGGMYFGLMDGRPDWGRFIVKSFKEIKEK
jgi:hypothetical protein